MNVNTVTKTIILRMDQKEALELSRKIEAEICKDKELHGFKYKYDYLKEDGRASFSLSGSEEDVREYSKLLKV